MRSPRGVLPRRASSTALRTETEHVARRERPQAAKVISVETNAEALHTPDGAVRCRRVYKGPDTLKLNIFIVA